MPPTPNHLHRPRPSPVLIEVVLRAGDSVRERISRPAPFRAHAGGEVAFVVLNDTLEPRTAWIEEDVFFKEGREVTKKRVRLFVEHPKSEPIPPLGFGTVRYRLSEPGVFGLSQKLKTKTVKYTIAVGDESGNLVERLDPQGDVEMPPAM